MKRAAFMDALSAFGQKPDTTQPHVAWTPAPDLPSGAGAPGSDRLRHIIGQLLQPNAIAYEAILKFDTDEAFNDFLKNKGRLKLLANIPSLRSVRVGYDNVDDLRDIPDGSDVSANYLVQLPAAPDPQGPGIQASAVPFGSGALSWLGIGDNETWGVGQKIAIIDTGVVEHPTLNTEHVSNSQDFVEVDGTTGTEINGHGTAVASVAAGTHAAAPGVAPAAQVLSFRVADSDGNSDSFTLAQGILAAAEAGADVINISLGSTGDSGVVEEAVNKAMAAGSTIVAAAGNNGADSLSYPAAYEGVISVGSVDAAGQHLDFSNTAESLNISAPGYAVPAAWPGEQVIQFTGTSASAPFVSGAIAAVMSWDPSLTGQQSYDLLVYHANEAGAPGTDAIYGEGILNVGRVVNAETSGIHDAAVASHYYAGDLGNNGREILQIVVENRGTELLLGSTLAVDSPVGKQQFNLGPIQPGGVVTREVVVDTRLAELQGQIDYRTNLTFAGNVVDDNPLNNQLSSSFLPPSAAETSE